MDLRKRLLDKIREQQYSAPGYAPVFVRNGQSIGQQRTSPTNGNSPPMASVGSPTGTNACSELVWKIIDGCRDQLQSLASTNPDDQHSISPPSLQRDYISKWNTAVWPLLDVSIMLNSAFSSPVHRRQESTNDYALRREIQQLLSTADDTSPVRRFQQAPAPVNDVAGILYQHYLAAAEQLTQLGSMIQSGSLVEDQLVFVLRQYRNAVSTFTNQVVPQVLNTEAIRVRALEQQRHTSSVDTQQNSQSRAQSPASNDASNSSKSASIKMSDHLTEFRSLLDWCFALVGTLVNNTIEMLNQTFLYAETNRYFAIMQSELQGIVPGAVMGLCRFILWVSNQPPMIMVTKTEFTCHTVLLNNYLAHSDQLHMQIVAESTAHEIQQKCYLKHTALVAMNGEPSFPAAGVLVMKKFDPSPATQNISLRRTLSTCAKRRRRSRAQPASTPTSAVPSPPSTGAFAGTEEEDYVFVNQSNAKTDEYLQNSTSILQNAFTQERLDVGWRYDQTARMVVAEAEQACCTDRNLTSESSNGTQATTADRQRDIYYLHCWTKLAIFGTWYNVHTLSLPFVIPTRKNQDLQLHRMLKSYSATIFWLHVAGKQDGFLIEWNDYMSWPQFVHSLNVYFMREARVSRGLSDFDFMLLKEKSKCSDCNTDSNGPVQSDKLAYQNIICPHLFYQCGDRPLLKHSLWRALLDLIQLFQNERTKVRELWERGMLGGLWSMDSVTKILTRHPRPVLMARISLLSGGSILMSFLSGHSVMMNQGAMQIMHTEPLDQQQLARRNLIDCIADLCESEGVEYVLDCNLQPLSSTVMMTSEASTGFQPLINVRANSDQLGCPNTHRQYTFNALKLSIVACRGLQNGARRMSPMIAENGLLKKSESVNGLIANKNGADGDSKNFQMELRELMHRYGYTSNDADVVCQKLASH